MDWMQAFGFDKLELKYTVSCEGMDGECFHYLVEFDAPVTDEKEHELLEALRKYDMSDEEKGIFAGEVWHTKFGCTQDTQIDIELDLGNCNGSAAFQNEVIRSILLALNEVAGVRKVIVNEGCDDFEM